MAEMGKLQEELDRRNAWDLDAQLGAGHGCLRCPPGDADGRCCPAVSDGAWRCALLLNEPDLLLSI